MHARWKHLKNNWAVHSYYERFESTVALVLTFVIALVVAVALYRLGESVVAGLIFGVLDPLDYAVFQLVFGNIMTLLIALEFNHTLRYVVLREESIIQTKVVLLVALLALARKFIILDLKETSAEHLLGLAAMTLVLGVTYGLLRERDDRLRKA